jgi:hypothetical protein
MFIRLWLSAIILVANYGLVFSVQADETTTAQLEKILQVTMLSYSQGKWQDVVSRFHQELKKHKAENYPKQFAKMYVHLGGALFHLNMKSLAVGAFEQAVFLDHTVSSPQDNNKELATLFEQTKTEALRFQTPPEKQAPKMSKAPISQSHQVQRAPVHIGMILGWTSAVLVGASLGIAIVAGSNAYVDANGASDLLIKARQYNLSQPLIAPAITEIHQRAVTYGTLANVFYVVAGVAIIGATGFFLWANFSAPPTKSVAIPQSTFASSDAEFSSGSTHLFVEER